jgi:sRNA-binding regulator protein Hfq
MTERTTNRPIRRRAKARDAKLGTPSSGEIQDRTGEAHDEESALPSEPPSLATGAAASAKEGGTRRVYEPSGAVPTEQAQRPRVASPATGAEVRNPAKKGERRLLTKEQQKAKKLAREKGIPPLHALRVVRGEVGINDVLKSLVRKDKTARLIAQDGLDHDLAGQVASGHLRLERAYELQRIRRFRVHRIDRDVIHIAAKAQGEIAFQAFDRSWQRGFVKESRIYEFDFVVEGQQASSESLLVQKHDVKTVCSGADFEQVRDAMTIQSSIVEQKLAGTSDPKERVRPKDATMLTLIEEQTPIECILRDGMSYRGQIVSFGRWDFDLKLESSAVITIFFHALHEATPWLD